MHTPFILFFFLSIILSNSHTYVKIMSHNVLHLLSTILTLLHRECLFQHPPHPTPVRLLHSHLTPFPYFSLTRQLASCRLCNHIVGAIFKHCQLFCSLEAQRLEICLKIKQECCQHIYKTITSSVMGIFY